MNFKKKLFLAIFIPTLITCSALLIYVYTQNTSSVRTEFTRRYDAFNSVLARSLVQIEENADRNMQNAGRLFQRHEAEYPGIGTPGIKKLSDDIGAANLFVANQEGKFVRATNDEVETMPNLLTACSSYANLLGNPRAFASTPVIASSAGAAPSKYLIVPNTAGTRFLQVAYSADYIQKTLQEAVSEDPSVQSVSLYSADGSSLGEFGPAASTARAPLTGAVKEGVEFSGEHAIFTKVIPLSDENCCECKALKAKSPNGYAYVLRTKVSSAVLASSTAQLKNVLKAGAGLAFIFSLLVSLVLSYFFVARLKKLRKVIDGISTSEQVKARVPGEGKDEIGVLSTSFNRMLERLEESHEKFLRREKAKLALRMTTQVAHEIRSPLAALNVVESDLAEIPRETRPLLRSAVNRVRDIANNLLVQPPNLDDVADLPKKDHPSVKLISYLLEPVVSEMRSLAKPGVTVECGVDANSYQYFAYVQPSEFQQAVGKLIKHAMDSFDERGGRVRVQLARVDYELVITVSDDSSGFANGAAADAFDAVVKQVRGAFDSWGGRVEVNFDAKEGTERRILLPVAEAPFWCVDRIEIPSNTTIVVIDDDSSIHQVWKRIVDFHRLKMNGCHLVCFSTAEEASVWIDENPKLKRTAMFFLDDEFPRGTEKGLSWIERHAIQSRSILVTNRFEERSVLEVCVMLRVRMIPKTMLGFVQIESALAARSPDRPSQPSNMLEI